MSPVCVATMSEFLISCFGPSYFVRFFGDFVRFFGGMEIE